VTPYPPGIPLLIPVKVFNTKSWNLKFTAMFARECPGFETDIHGLAARDGSDGHVAYFADLRGRES